MSRAGMVRVMSVRGTDKQHNGSVADVVKELRETGETLEQYIARREVEMGGKPNRHSRRVLAQAARKVARR